MKFKALFAVVLMTGWCMTAWAGSITGKVSGMKGRSVVYVDTIAGKTFPAPKEHQVMDQKGMLFSPHVMAVQQGTTVEFLNSDNVQHNVFWSAVGNDKKAGRNLGTWPKGEKRPFAFDKPGVVPLFCNVHPEMEAYLVVSPTPYFAETDDSGSYKINDVPDGSYSLIVWHERAKGQTKSVTVLGDTTADFTVSK